jgi:hypothetical protein
MEALVVSGLKDATAFHRGETPPVRVRTRERRPADASPIVYPRDAVLTIQQVAAGLQLSVRSVERAHFPVHYIGRMPRFIWGEILDALARMKL